MVSNVTLPYGQGVIDLVSATALTFIVIGVTGNLVTLVALYYCMRLRAHAATAFVASLTISDLLYCGLNLPFLASIYLLNDWPYSDALCAPFVFLNYSNVCASLMSLTAITINRYVLIVHPCVYPRIYTSRNVVLMIIFCWTFGVFWMLLPLTGAWGQLGFDPVTFQCTIKKGRGGSLKSFVLIMGFIVPCLTIIAAYSRIFIVVRASATALKLHASAQPARKDREDTTEQKLTRMIFIIFSCFLLCFAPSIFISVADESGEEWPTAHVLANIPVWASSVINPFIYALSNPLYRRAYRDLLCGWRQPPNSVCDTQLSNLGRENSS